MSSHDARYEDSPARDDELGTRITRTDQQPLDRDDVDRDDVDRDDPEADGGPVLLPVDPRPEPVVAHGPGTAAGSAGTVGSADLSVGPDSETGALKDPVPDGAFPTGAPATPDDSPPAGADESATAASAAPSPAVPSASSNDDDWRELQGRFVDDPQAAVREAGDRVEKALNDLRSRSESGSTEDLRTAFRRYRDLHTGLS